MSTDAYQARRTVTEEKKAGTLLNAAGRSPVKSVLFLDNGAVVASPLSVNRLLTAIEKANHKPNSKPPKNPPEAEQILSGFDADDDDGAPTQAEDYGESE